MFPRENVSFHGQFPGRKQVFSSRFECQGLFVFRRGLPCHLFKLAIEVGQVGITRFPGDAGDWPAGVDQQTAGIVDSDAGKMVKDGLSGFPFEEATHGIGVHADFSGNVVQ